MKSASTTTISGCIIWLILFALLSLCFLPVAMIIGGPTSVTGFAMQTVAPLICPDGSTTSTRTYATTTTDEFGNSEPSTAYVLQCVNANGEVVKEDPVAYAFMWTAGLAIIGLVLAGVLAFVFAAPAGVMIGRMFNRGKKPDITTNVEV